MSNEAAALRGPAKPVADALQPLNATCIAFIVLSTVFVSARFLSRCFIGHVRLGWDDVWIVPAWFTILALCVIGLLIVKFETASSIHASNEPITSGQDLTPLLKTVYALPIMVTTNYFTTRLSVLSLYLRLFVGKTNVATWCLIGFVTIQWLAFMLPGFFLCNPVRMFWDRTIRSGHCHSIDAYYRSITPPNIAVDIVLIALPLPVVWHLNFSRLRKVGLLIIFGWSGVALVASCLRTWIYERYTAAEVVPNTSTPLIELAVLEPGLYLIAACLPAMHHLLVILTPRSLRRKMNQAVSKPHEAGAPGHNLAMAKTGRLGGQREASFTRLVDYTPPHQTKEQGQFRSTADTASEEGANRGRHLTLGGSNEGKMKKNFSQMDVEDWAATPATPSRDGTENDSRTRPPDELRRMQEAGRAIMVQTEIITQEERIESILGI